MILLTGSRGFIARNFAKVLNDEVIYSVDQELVDNWDWYNQYIPWTKIKLILHQGAISSTTETNPIRLFEYNVRSSIRLFQKAVDHGIPVKYASSASVYGNGSGPLNQYALSKLQLDLWVKDNIDKFSLIQGFRYFNVYGPGEENKGNQASPIETFTKQAIKDGVIKVFEGSRKFYRDFIWVGDLTSLVLNNDKLSGIYDLGTSNPISFLEVAEMIAKKYNAEIKTIPFPDHLQKKYQYYTSAKKIWSHKFKTVEEYINDNSIR